VPERSLWFTVPTARGEGTGRQTLTSERVVAEALAVIAEEGLGALTMRALAARLGVVPAALYRHVRSKEQLQDLVIDGVLAEVDYQGDGSPAWTVQLKTLAQRLRTVLEAHPGVAGLLKARDPLGPHSLELAEAFLRPLRAAGFADRDAGLAYFAVVDYVLGFEAGGSTSANEQRVRDAATRQRLHTFFRELPVARFPALVSLGEHVWVDNRDERFAAGLDVIVRGLQHGGSTVGRTRSERGPDHHAPARPRTTRSRLKSPIKEE
jgi:AcrR family transcriptional regulator